MNMDFSKLDLLTVKMARALETLAIPYQIETKQWPRDEKSYWLRFKVNGYELWYRKGFMGEVDLSVPKIGLRNVNHLSELIIQSKQDAKKHLRNCGFNVPDGKMFRRRHREKVLAYYEKIAKPVCVKPNNGKRGRCVTTSINDFEHYKNAVDVVAKQYSNMVVEESVEGKHYRFFYCHPKVVGVRMGVQLGVVGNGYSDISELIDEKNEQRARQARGEEQIEVNEDILRHLAVQGHTLESIPNKDERVMFYFSSGAPAGADTITFELDTVHPSYLDLVERACQSLPGLHYTGVDLVIKDITRPAQADNYWILEFNPNPGFTAFYSPLKGPSTDIAVEILKSIMLCYPLEIGKGRAAC